MRKFFCALFILSVFFFFPNITFADELEFALYDISTGVAVATTTINWDITKITPGADKWVWSTTYAKIKAKDIPLHVIYYIYQNNKEGSTYKAENFRTEEEKGVLYHRYNGLVNKDKKGGEDKGFIPLSYVMISSTLTASDLQKDYDPNICKTDTDGLDKSARYFMDKDDCYLEGDVEKNNFEENKGYCPIAGWDRTIMAQGQGPVFWYYDNEWGNGYVCWTSDKIIDHTAYMYFGGNFKNASKGDVFGTNKIIIEKVIE